VVHPASGFTRGLMPELPNAIHATLLSSRVPVHAPHRWNHFGLRLLAKTGDITHDRVRQVRIPASDGVTGNYHALTAMVPTSVAGN